MIITDDIARRLFGDDALDQEIYVARRALTREDVEGRSPAEMERLIADIGSWELGEPYIVHGVITPLRLWGVTSAESAVFTDVRLQSTAEVAPERRNPGKYVIALRPGVDQGALLNEGLARRIQGGCDESIRSGNVAVDGLCQPAARPQAGAAHSGIILASCRDRGGEAS